MNISMNKASMLITLNILFTGMLMTTDSPLLMWMLMEMGNIMFIILFTLMQNNVNTPALLLLIQFFSSTMILMGIIDHSNTFMSIGILIKLGLFPSHNWMPMLIYLSPWNLIMMTMTLPKIQPFLFMDMITNSIPLLIATALTPFAMTIKLIKSNNNKVIMAMSSMIHSSWMVLIHLMSFKSWFLYLSIYLANTIMICKLMSLDMFNNVYKPHLTKLMMMMMLFSLMSMPPVTMFIGKLYLIAYAKYSFLTPLSSLILASAVSVMYYSRLFLQTIFFFGKTKKSKIPTHDPLIDLNSIMFMILFMMVI